MKVTNLIASTIAIAASFVTTPLMAEGKHEHGDKAGHADNAHFTVAPPADLKAAWTMITTSLAAAEAKPETVHESAETLEVAFHALEEKAAMVTGDAKIRLASVLKQADKANDALHHGAEEKDAAKVMAELKKLKALLPLIEAQFPAGALK